MEITSPDPYVRRARATTLWAGFLLLLGDLHMPGALVPDALWKLIEPLLPIPSPKPQSGRPRLTDRACLAGIIFVLRNSLADAAKSTGLRLRHDLLATVARLAAGRNLGLIHFALLDWLSRDGQIDWSHAVVDSCSVRAVFGAADWAKSHR